MPDKEVRIRIVERENTSPDYYVYVVEEQVDLHADTEVRRFYNPLSAIETVMAALQLGQLPNQDS